MQLELKLKNIPKGGALEIFFNQILSSHWSQALTCDQILCSDWRRGDTAQLIPPASRSGYFNGSGSFPVSFDKSRIHIVNWKFMKFFYFLKLKNLKNLKLLRIWETYLLLQFSKVKLRNRGWGPARRLGTELAD